MGLVDGSRNDLLERLRPQLAMPTIGSCLTSPSSSVPMLRSLVRRGCVPGER